MADQEERILGEIQVVSKLTVGSERLSLFVTDSRLIVARIGKRGTGSMTAFPIFSILTSGLEGLFRWRKDSARKHAAEVSLTPAGILAADKENFPIRYDEIVAVSLEQTPTGRTGITIVTRDDKLLFSTPMSIDKVSEMIRVKLDLSKLTITRAPQQSLR